MTDRRNGIEDAAIDWALRTGDPAFDDWEGLQAWLEADPAHAARYHAVAVDVADMARTMPRGSAPVTPVESRPTRRSWIGGALAASVAGLIGYMALSPSAQPYAIETAAGVTRTVSLADGSAIALNGATRLMLDRADPRVATLERGEALFVVRHDDARPFTVSVGDDTLVDVGTAFGVTRTAGETRVGVSEGAVDFNPRGEAVRLVAGQELLVSDAGRTILRGRVDIAAVGAWRQGWLDYDGASLARVAADLSRSLGVSIAVDRSVSARPFRGTVALAGLAREPARVAPLLGVSMRRSGAGWVMTARP